MKVALRRFSRLVLYGAAKKQNRRRVCKGTLVIDFCLLPGLIGFFCLWTPFLLCNPVLRALRQDDIKLVF